jgi:hypothetical protein
MSILDILIILLIAVLVVMAWRTSHKKGGCSCGCGNCKGHKDSCCADKKE